MGGGAETQHFDLCQGLKWDQIGGNLGNSLSYCWLLTFSSRTAENQRMGTGAMSIPVQVLYCKLSIVGDYGLTSSVAITKAIPPLEVNHDKGGTLCI